MRTVLILNMVAQTLLLTPLRTVAQGQSELSEVLELRDEVRGLQQRELFESAIELLEATLVLPDPSSTELLREIHLLLVETHVLYGNALDFEEKPAMAGLSWEKAREWARKCLEHEALRDTDPRSVPEYPERGIRLFQELHREMFGSLRVDRLDPPDAEVRLDGKLLEQLPDEPRVGALYVPVGEHTVLVRREGYQDHVETILVEGGSSIQKEYGLEKKRGFWWYALRGTGVVAVGTTIAWLAGAFEDGTSEQSPSPLPEPPNPPSR
jgi:hypothetical protein